MLLSNWLLLEVHKEDAQFQELGVLQEDADNGVLEVRHEDVQF